MWDFPGNFPGAWRWRPTSRETPRGVSREIGRRVQFTGEFREKFGRGGRISLFSAILDIIKGLTKHYEKTIRSGNYGCVSFGRYGRPYAIG